MKKVFILSLCCLMSTLASAQEKCSKDQAKEAVQKICKLIEEKGESAKADIQSFRFCGDNYVWVQDQDVKMVIHPIKSQLNGSDLKGTMDEDGKHIFLEFDKMAKMTPDGSWVKYVWPKPGAQKATPKISFVKTCGGSLKWVAGSGVWLN